MAWITEQKNTLSAVFYLGALLAYLRFDQARKTSSYCWALGLFLLGILTKTVIATLPGALLVIFWWQRGRLSWKNDVLPLLPFFLLGAGGGMITAWWELQVNKCVGPEFALTLVERCLIAGRTVWFLSWKLFWPTQLTFIYPRWQIDVGIWWQYMFPLGAVALLAVLWSIRRWTRAPLAAVLFFGGTLFPTLGFFNLYTFLYSFVANHYQYLAGLGIITLVSAGAALLLHRWRLWGRPAGYALCLVPLAILGHLTWRQSHMYSDVEMLYRTVIAENPDCWMAHGNLGMALKGRGQLDEAIVEYRKVVELNPNNAKGHGNLGAALAGCGQLDEAITEYRKVLELNPDDEKTHYNLGVALKELGQLDEAIAEYRNALKINPNDAGARGNLGLTLNERGQFDEAIAECQKVVQINPNDSKAHNNLGLVLAGSGHFDEAIAEYRDALKINPDDFKAHGNLGIVLASRRHFDEAIAEYRDALKINPDDADVHGNLALALASRGQLDEAIAEYRKLLELNPNDEKTHNILGAALAGRGHFDEAIAEYRDALKINPNDANAHANLGLALRERGLLDEAIAEYQKVLQINPNDVNAHGNLGLALKQRGQLDEAIAEYQKVLELNPKDAKSYNNIAWIRATHPDPRFRNAAEAVALATRAVELARDDVNSLDTLAAAYAEAGRFSEAVQTAHKALELATQQNNQSVVESIKAKIPLYEAGNPFREMRPASPHSARP